MDTSPDLTPGIARRMNLDDSERVVGNPSAISRIRLDTDTVINR